MEILFTILNILLLVGMVNLKLRYTFEMRAGALTVELENGY